MRQKRTKEMREQGLPRGGKIAEQRSGLRSSRARAMTPPPGSMSRSLEGLIAASSRKQVDDFHAASLKATPDAEAHLRGGRKAQQQVGHVPFGRAGRSPDVAAYAGGAIINSLPKSKAHRRP